MHCCDASNECSEQGTLVAARTPGGANAQMVGRVVVDVNDVVVVDVEGVIVIDINDVVVDMNDVVVVNMNDVLGSLIEETPQD